MDNQTLIKRCDKCIKEVGLRVDRFCENAEIGKSTFYRWKKGKITISDRKKANIDLYLQKFGY